MCTLTLIFALRKVYVNHSVPPARPFRTVSLHPMWLIQKVLRGAADSVPSYDAIRSFRVSLSQLLVSAYLIFAPFSCDFRFPVE